MYIPGYVSSKRRIGSQRYFIFGEKFLFYFILVKGTLFKLHSLVFLVVYYNVGVLFFKKLGLYLHFSVKMY